MIRIANKERMMVLGQEDKEKDSEDSMTFRHGEK